MLITLPRNRDSDLSTNIAASLPGGVDVIFPGLDGKRPDQFPERLSQERRRPGDLYMLLCLCPSPKIQPTLILTASETS